MSFDTASVAGWKRRNLRGLLREARLAVMGSPGRKSTRASRLSIEVLEDRLAMSTFRVTNSSDGPMDGPPGSLRYAINQAEQSSNATNLVVITPKVGNTIALNSGEISFGKSVSIVNQSGHGVEISQTTLGARVFNITDDGQSSQVRFLIGAASKRNTLSITGGNSSGGNGGGILVQNANSMLTLRNVALVGNSATIVSPFPTLVGGGGIYTSGQLVLDHSLVGGNQTTATGGGIFANGNVTISQSSVNQNVGLNVGGIYETDGDVKIVRKSQVDTNSSTAPLPPVGRTLDGNFGGGGIGVVQGNVLVSQSEVSYNQANSLYCSGIVILSGNVMIRDRSQVNWNHNYGPGGGIALNFQGSVTVTGHSQVDHNTAAGMGGGIVNFASPVRKVKIDQQSEVNDNTLTNAVSIGEVIIIFLNFIAVNFLHSDYQTLTGLTTDQSEAMIHQVEAEIGSAHGTDPSAAGLVIAGGGVGTLLGARVTIGGGSSVDGNFSNYRLPPGSLPGGNPNPNSVGIGGGVATFLSRVDVDRSSVSTNISSEDGGGIWTRRDTSITGSTVTGNTALGETLGALGGGLFLGSPSRHSLIRSSNFSNNGAVGAVGTKPSFGGGAFNLGSLTVRGSTISGNNATQSGGGLFNGLQLKLRETEVENNNATLSGGGLYNKGLVDIKRSQIVDNTPDNIAP